MADIVTREKRSAVMSTVCSHGNKTTELRLIALFRAHGITGWRRGATLQWKVESSKLKAFRVRPYFVFPARKLAVFVDGCFWHGCPVHATKPKNHAGLPRLKRRGDPAPADDRHLLEEQRPAVMLAIRGPRNAATALRLIALCRAHRSPRAAT